ncbi:MAG TPA: M67 family peptidase [Acidilobales archaeon]|nr:M67 family peptidase [Acidilobales archaeon]
MKVLVIRKKDLVKIISEASKRTYEICGFLLGARKNNILEVLEVAFINNVSTVKEKAFYMDPIKIYNTLMYANRKSLEVIGIFHSHPNSTTPSRADLKYMRLWNIPWLIVNSYSKKYEAYILSNGRLEKIQVILKD